MSDLYFSINRENGNVILESQLPADKNWISYALFISITTPIKITVGKLGEFIFPGGDYIYYGSARKGLRARVNRHLRSEKKLHWHIDYLLAAAAVTITRIRISTISECQLVAAGGGAVVVKGFGASDCIQACGSHLRRI